MAQVLSSMLQLPALDTGTASLIFQHVMSKNVFWQGDGKVTINKEHETLKWSSDRSKVSVRATALSDFLQKIFYLEALGLSSLQARLAKK